MAEVATTTMSSKGQVVIPEKIREKLHLKKGAEFIVISSDDALIFKPIIPPSPKEFSVLLKRAKLEAQRAGLTEADIEGAIRDVRRER